MNTTNNRPGGLAVAKLNSPLSCHRCGKQFPFLTERMAYLGHLGLHGLADKYFNGDIKAAQERLRQNGLARQEQGASWQNGAFKPYRPIQQNEAHQ